ncbi:hypothetical protein LUZ60_007678 [Juncus effusus]|nr:hypothetical protein LUZ60_007678 [Juncus effusus]
MPLHFSPSSGALALHSSPLIRQSFLPNNPYHKLRCFPSIGRTGLHTSLESNYLCRFRAYCTKTGAHSLELPFLPFVLDEVLIPTESKTLHLYEARFLSLLEEAVSEKNKTFVHFVLDPLARNESSFGASYCCLIHIENIKQLPIGALVSIRGIGRVDIVEVVQMEPYLRGIVIPVQDNIPDQVVQLDSRLSKLRDSIAILHSLQIKLKVPKIELLQTQIKSSLLWAESEIQDDYYQNFVPKLAERVSFSAFQPISGMLDSELETLQREKLRAMELKDTAERLERGIDFVTERIKMVAARLAIQSI